MAASTRASASSWVSLHTGGMRVNVGKAAFVTVLVLFGGGCGGGDLCANLGCLLEVDDLLAACEANGNCMGQTTAVDTSSSTMPPPCPGGLCTF